MPPMPPEDDDTDDTSDLPVEIAAFLWADAYRRQLRAALVPWTHPKDLAVLDLAVDVIERKLSEAPSRAALAA